MVELSKYRRNSSFSVLPCFIGGSLVILSIGLSIAIARSENLSFTNNKQRLSLNEEINKLEEEAHNIKRLADKIKDGKESLLIKKEAEEILKEVEITEDSINKIIQN